MWSKAEVEMIMSKVLTVWISTGYVGGDKKLSVPIEDNLSEKEIQETAEDLLNEMIDWGYYIEEV